VNLKQSTIALLLLVTTCVSNVSSHADAPTPPPSPETLAVASGANRLGWRVLDQVLTEEKHEERRSGVFISPLSLATALQIATVGASGTTYEELARVVGTGEMTPRDMQDGIAGLRRAVRGVSQPPPKRESPWGGEVSLSVANGIWIAPKLKFRDTYRQQCYDWFGSEVGPLSPKNINDWVKKQTGGKIPSIVPEDMGLAADEGPGAAITNAIYLKATWREKFMKENTEPDEWTRADQTKVQVPLMKQMDVWAYAEGPFGQAAALDYGTKRNLRMVVLLPPATSSLSLREFADTQLWATIWGKLKSRDGTIIMPRFKADCSYKMRDTFKRLQMTGSFKPTADFEKMVDPDLVRSVFGPASGGVYLGEIFHELTIDVDENGTEAAAATAVSIPRPASAPPPGSRPPPPFRLELNRPFVAVIEETSTGVLLFAGVVLDPSAG